MGGGGGDKLQSNDLHKLLFYLDEMGFRKGYPVLEFVMSLEEEKNVIKLNPNHDNLAI